jgi:hypothetical protein
MKKILLSAMALVAAMSVNAQVEIGAMTQERADAIFVGEPNTAQKDKTDLTNWKLDAGTVLFQTESVVCTNLFSDDYGYAKTGLSKNNVKVNGEDFGSVTGIQGSVNGPGTAASTGEFPTQGCVYHFVPSKDGYLYVMHKASANKNYVVFEEKTRIPYIFSAETGAYDLATIEGATVTDGEGITTISPDYAIGKAQEIIGEDGKGAGTCVIKFQVFKDLAYDVLATGSKMTTAGFVFDTDGKSTITLETANEDGSVDVTTLLKDGAIPGSPDGILAVKTAKAQSNVLYNLAGQKVNSNYKGVVVVNGQKMIQK